MGKNKKLPELDQFERRKLFHSLVFPAFFVFILWAVKLTETGLQIHLTRLGVFPLEMKGLVGIVTHPLVHADFRHLFDNSIPLFFLSLACFYFYREVAYRVFFSVQIGGGALVWIFGRPSWHIGASGLIYGLAAFLFLSGILRKNRSLMAISLLVSFLYGSLVWGLLPYDYSISWEGHLAGGVSGVLLSIIYRRYGPESDFPQWPEDNENLENEYPDDLGGRLEEDMNNPPPTDPLFPGARN